MATLHDPTIVSGPAPATPLPRLTYDEFILHRIATHAPPNRLALVDASNGAALTYGAFVNAVHTVAAALLARGFRQGDVFMLYTPNSVEFVVMFFAVLRAGGVITTINPMATKKEFLYQAAASDARWVLTTPTVYASIVQPAALSLDAIVVVGASADDAAVGGYLTYAQLSHITPGVPVVELKSPARHEDLAVLPFSSGTTGLPKGVMLSHRNMVASVRATACDFETDPEKLRSFMCVLPLFHIFGMCAIMGYGLYQCATLVIMPKFSLEPFLDIMARYAISRAYLVPPIILAMAKYEKLAKYDLSHLRTIISAAAPLGEETVKLLHTRLPNVTALQGYGLSETTALSHLNRPDNARIDSATVGWLCEGVEGKVIDIEGRPLLRGEIGEICLRGPIIMMGYYKNKKATDETLVNGWLHTGDVGLVDTKGCWYIKDRIKELIKTNSYQVAPAELEALLVSHPQVRDAAVIPVPDERAGERPKAYVVLRPGATATPKEIKDWTNATVSSYKHLVDVVFIDLIPKTPSGKILRRVLRDRDQNQNQPVAKL